MATDTLATTDTQTRRRFLKTTSAVAGDGKQKFDQVTLG